MAKYPYRELGTGLGRDFRNDLNANFDDVEEDLIDQKNRVDNLITNVEQPSEVVDARYDAINDVTHTTLKERLDSTTSSLAQIVPVDVLKYGADKTGVNDSTIAFRNAIKEAYDMSYSTTGWRNPVQIIIPFGKYLITDTIIDTLLGVTGGRFIIKSDGWQATEIIYQPTDTAKFLFDNNDVFGLTTFEGVSFTAGSTGAKFMNCVGTGDGYAQSLIFSKCRWGGHWNNLMTVTGAKMMSEITFIDSKISGGEASGSLFHLENDQAVNWRFFGTDIENFVGVLFNYVKGMTISYFQGSVIPADGTIIQVPSTADVNTFGSATSPNIQMYGVKIEMRDYSKLLNITRKNVGFTGVFSNCGLGGINLATDTAHYVCEVTGRGRITFDNCYNWSNYKFKHTVDGASDNQNPMIVEFRGNAPTALLIQNAEVVYTAASYNKSASPIYNFVDGDLSTSVRADGYNRFAPNFDFPVKKHFHSFVYDDKAILKADGTATKTFEINLPQVELVGFKIMLQPTSGYGSWTYNMKLIDNETATTIVSEDVDLTVGETIVPPSAFLGHYFSKTGKLTVEVSPVTSHTNTSIPIKGAFMLEY